MAEIDAAKRAMLAAAVLWAKKAGDDLLGRAQRDAPVEEGTLRASGAVDVSLTADGVEVEVSFNTPYAARQHEELDWQHPMGGKAKYLEDNLKAQAGRYEASLAAAIGKAL